MGEHDLPDNRELVDQFRQLLAELPFLRLPTIGHVFADWRKGQLEVCRPVLAITGLDWCCDLTDEQHIALDRARMSVVSQIEWHARQLGIYGESEGIRSGDTGKVFEYLTGACGILHGQIFTVTCNEVLELLRDACRSGIKVSQREQAKGDELDDLVTLDQVAPLTGLSKRSLERHLKKTLPPPDIPGGHGKAHRWYWRNLRAGLENITNRQLPVRFPASRIV